MKQELFPAELMARLAANGEAAGRAIGRDGNTPDQFPVLKLFTPMGGATWLLSEYHPEQCEGGAFYGLCDLGQGEPELGYVSKAEIEDTAFSRNPQLIERDEWFEAKHPLSVYAEASRLARRIVEDV